MRLALVADTHPPFEDERAIDAACRVIEAAQPDELVHLGDGVDFYALSHYDKDPDRLLGLQNEIDRARAVNKILASAAPRAKKRYIPGNHEARLARYLHKHPEIAGLDALRLDRLLHFAEGGWELESDYITYCGRRLVLKHGGRISKHSAYSAKMLIDDLGGQASGCIGHTHRQGEFHQTGFLYEVGGYEIGCLCSFETYKLFPNWQRGMAIIDILSKTKFRVELVPISAPSKRKRIAYWRGKEYEA